MAITLITAGCTEQPEVIPYEYSKMFTGETHKAWIIRSVVYTEEGHANQPVGLADCVEDDVYVFYANADRTAEVLNGNEKCDPEEPDVIAVGTWSFANANASLTLPFPLIADFEIPFIVREVEEDRMTLEFFLDDKSSYRFNFRVEDLE